MISATEKEQIHKYLLSKKLPIDVLLEVRDHFENQVESFEQEKEISFNDAFILTQNAWEKDFRLVKKSFFSFGKVPAIVKEIQKETTKKLVKKSLIIAIALILFQFLTAKFLVKDYYFIINVAIYSIFGVLILGMILIYVFSRINKQRTRAEKYFYNQILNIFLVSILLGAFGVFTKLPTNSFKIIYDFVNGINEYPAEYFVAAITSSTFNMTITFYLFFILLDRAKSIKKVKNYLTPSF